MAIYPCQFGNHRYGGAQQSVYATLAEGSASETRKARVCPKHLEQIELRAGETLDRLEDEAQASFTCQACDASATSHVFMTFYAGQGEPYYYVGDFCAAHAAAALGSVAWHEWPLRSA